MDLLNLLSNVWHEKSHSPMKYNSAQTQKYQTLEFLHELPIEKVEVGQLQAEQPAGQDSQCGPLVGHQVRTQEVSRQIHSRVVLKKG